MRVFIRHDTFFDEFCLYRRVWIFTNPIVHMEGTCAHHPLDLRNAVCEALEPRWQLNHIANAPIVARILDDIALRCKVCPLRVSSFDGFSPVQFFGFGARTPRLRPGPFAARMFPSNSEGLAQ